MWKRAICPYAIVAHLATGACAQLLGEDAAKTSHFASYLREVFLPGTEMLTMEVAAATLGHLVKSGGALTADIVEFEVATPRQLCSAAHLFTLSVACKVYGTVLGGQWWA